jgi:Protein of unknown function with HXXEE motif
MGSPAPQRVRGLAIIPLALLIHNLEEALTIASTLPKVQALLLRTTGVSIALPSATQFCIALMLLTAAAFALYLWCRVWDGAVYALVVLQAVMALNVIAHATSSVVLGGYAAGVVTAVLVQLPTSVLVFRRVRAAGWMSRLQWRLLPLLAVLLHGPALLLLLAGARKLG